MFGDWGRGWGAGGLLGILVMSMSQARKKNVARPGLQPRVSRLPCEHSIR